MKCPFIFITVYLINLFQSTDVFTCRRVYCGFTFGQLKIHTIFNHHFVILSHTENRHDINCSKFKQITNVYLEAGGSVWTQKQP